MTIYMNELTMVVTVYASPKFLKPDTVPAWKG